MTGSRRPSRRRFLAGVAASGLAGATLVGRGVATEESGGPDATGAAVHGSDPAGVAADANFTSTHRDWPMFGQDPVNSGATADAGPGDGVSIGWERDLRPTVSPVVRGNFLYVGTGESVVSIDRRTGETRWTVDLGAAVSGTPAVNDDRVYVPADDGTLLTYLVESGEASWSYDLQGTSPTAVAITGGEDPEVYVADDAGYMYEIGPRRGNRQWEYDAGGVGFSTPVVASTGTTTAYAVADDNSIHTVDLETGRSRWTHTRIDEDRATGPPAVDGQYLFVGDDAGTLHGIDSRNGERRWTFETDGPVTTAPAFERQRVYVATETGTLHAVENQDDTEIWRTDLGAGVTTSPVVAENGPIVPLDDGSVVRLDRQGNEVWRANLSMGTPRICVTRQVFAVGDGVKTLESGDRSVITATPAPSDTPTDAGGGTATDTATEAPDPATTVVTTEDDGTPTAMDGDSGPSGTETSATTQRETGTSAEGTPMGGGTSTTESTPLPVADTDGDSGGADGGDGAGEATTTADGALPAWITLAGIGGLTALGVGRSRRDDGDGSE